MEYVLQTAQGFGCISFIIFYSFLLKKTHKDRGVELFTRLFLWLGAIICLYEDPYALCFLPENDFTLISDVVKVKQDSGFLYETNLSQHLYDAALTPIEAFIEHGDKNGYYYMMLFMLQGGYALTIGGIGAKYYEIKARIRTRTMTQINLEKMRQQEKLIEMQITALLEESLGINKRKKPVVDATPAEGQIKRFVAPNAYMPEMKDGKLSPNAKRKYFDAFNINFTKDLTSIGKTIKDLEPIVDMFGLPAHDLVYKHMPLGTEISCYKQRVLFRLQGGVDEGMKGEKIKEERRQRRKAVMAEAKKGRYVKSPILGLQKKIPVEEFNKKYHKSGKRKGFQF